MRRGLDAGLSDPVDVLAYADPLDALRDDHLRQREGCAGLERIAERGQASAAALGFALSVVGRGRTAHLRDEEEGLFPLLRRRAEPEDEVERLLSRLEAEHLAIARGLDAVRAALLALRGGAESLSREARAVLREHADAKRRHLILENAVLLPLARLRLTAQDRAGLRAGMAARRGLAPPMKEMNA